MTKKLMTARRLFAAGMLTAMGFLLGGSNVLAQAPPAPDYGWTFSEQAGAEAGPKFGDTSGTLEGAAEWSSDDPFGGKGSVSFDGSDGSIVTMEGMADALNGLSNFSLSIWIKSADAGIDKGFWEAVDSGGGDLWGLRYDSTGASAGGSNVIKLGITTSESGGNTNRGQDQQETKEDVQTTEWQHLVMTWSDGDGFNFYIDGVLDEPTSAMENTVGTLSDMDRFVLGDGAKAHWVGLIDEVAVWASTLTADQAAWLSKNSIESIGGGLARRAFFWDFDGDLPDGSVIEGSAEHGAEDGVDGSGALVLTRNEGSQRGGWLSPEIGTVDKFNINFDVYIADGTDTQADGISMAISDDLVDGFSHFGEEGPENGGSKLIVCFDNWDNGGAEAPAIDIKWGKEVVATAAMGVQGESTLDTDGWWPVEMVLTTDGDLSISYNGELIHDAVNIAGFESIDNAHVAFGGRTGGANANHFVDNFEIVLEAGSGGPRARGLEDGLIGFWPFDDRGDLTEDISDGGNDGQVNGGAEFVAGHTGGASDYAVQFDGIDDSVTTEVGLLNDLDELTLSFWMLMPEEQEGNRVGLIGQNDAVEYGMINPTTMQYWTPVGAVDVAFGPTLEEWTHVAVVVDGDGMRVYSNGEMIAENAGAGGAVNSGDTFNMGGDGVFDATGNFFKGSIDDVAVWNIGLSDDDIADLASGAAEPIPVSGGGSLVETVPGLIAYWPFDGDLDDAVGDSDGTAQGSTDIAFADAQFGEGIDLDGVDQFVETPAENEEMFDFQDGTGFSISAWFSVNEFSKSWQALIAKGEGNRWRVHRRGGESIMTGNGGAGDVPAGGTDVTSGEIHHLVLVSDPDGGEVRFYIDGELESTGGAPNIESNDNPMMIGENPDARNRTWSGLIDDVGIWDRPITEDEVATIWNGGSGKPLMYMTEGGAPPSMAKFIPNASGFVMNIADGATAFTDKDLKVTVGGTVIENPTITQADGVTAIEASLPEPMAAGSEVTGKVSFSDSGGMTVRLKKDYAVPPYTVIAPGLKAESSLKGGSGFLAYATQISLSQSDSASLHGGEAGAMDQFLGLLADSETGDTWLNEADSDGLDSWTYFVEQIDVVNQTDDLDSDEDGNYVPLPSGKFSVETGHPDDILSGIETSWDDTGTDGYVNGYLALVELPAGSTTFGLNVKNGYIASIAPDFGASAGSQVGGAKKVFNVYVQEAGLYPLQILFYESAAKAYIELYSIVDGAPVLVNDSGVAGSLKAYTVKGAETGGGVEEIASTGRASIISVSPEDGATARSANVKVVVRNASTSVKEDTVKLTVNGEAVDASVSKDGDLVTISYTGSAVGPNAAMLSYGESNGSGNHIAWSYDYAAIYANKAAVPTEAQGGITVHEYSGTGGSSLSNLYNDENYPDSPTRSLVAPYFEWPQTGDIEVQPAGNIWDNYGLLIMGYIHPPETGEYFFYGCSDDQMETWLSTDEDPANARLILNESSWRDPRQFQAQGSEETSGAIFLEAGKAYYVEMKKKEGGGGDNAALAWSTPSDEGMDVDVGGLPISGDHLSPYVWSGATVPELGATSPTGILGTNDYTVSVAVNNGESVKVAKFTKLEVGGENVLADAEIAYGGVSATAKVDGESDPSTEVVVLVEWNNSDGTTGSASYDFMTSPHSETALYIETEDFNYDGGEWFTFEETEGGGAYEGLGFVSGIDINNNGNASENYREGGGNHPGMADSTGFDGNRGDWDMDVDFKMGWNDGGDWYNYTRDFPETSTYYNVIARLSSGGSPPVTKLSVVTSDSTAADQTIEDLGIFSGPSTACWNCFEFYPLQDENGKKKLVKLGGVTTLRHSLVSGNHDSNYIMFVPSAVQEFPPSIVSKGAVVSAEGNADVTVVLKKMELALANEQLSINGEAIDTAVATDGDLITLTGSATALPAGPGTVTVSYNNVSESWDIEVPYTTTSNKPVNNGDGTITYAGHLAWEWWDGIDGHLPEHLNNLINDARYPGSPDGATWTTSFATRTALCCGFDGDGRNNYGGRMSGILTAPETGTYRFFLASDDASVLRISTDTDPANAVQVAHEDGCCKNFTLSDGVLSGTVDLEEGQQYYMEAIVKEGGGGDWLTVAWRKPSEDIDSVPAGGNSDRTLNSIPGKYFVGKQVIPALSAKVSPAHDAIDVAPESTITVTVSNGTTTLDVDSVSISLNGNKLEHAVAEGTGTFGTTYSITASTGRLKGGSQNSITVTLKDSAGAETTIESSFRTKSYHTVDMSKGVKYIEAEDFNYDGGSYKTFEEVGLGGSYEGLGAVTGIDFNNSGNASEQYRSIPGNHPGMTDSSWDSGRGGFSMEVDFKMGWNDDGDWYNYTRDFPEGGKYAVYGRFSSGGSDINNKLSIVTSDATAADQTIEDVGVFQGPNTGGWNNMEFFLLQDADGAAAVVELSGTSTVRLSKVGGNMDANYLAFVPYEEYLLHSAELDGLKFVEAEDFNYDGGSYKTFEEVGLGGSYEGLGAVTGIDFNNSGNASEQYRSIPGNHPGMTDSSWDSERGGGNGFSMEVDFKMGWNDDGDWYNYTRDFPEDGHYAVYGRFSSGGSDINNKLSIVTSDATAADQTIEDVGVFQGPNTGGWNNMEFFPLKDADGNLATVSISGTTTVRLTKVGGNMDANYMVFVPVAAPAGPGDISAPGDAVVASSDNSPGGEQAPNAIDDDPSTKYLNFDGANNTPSGLTITTSGGVVTGLGLTSANDAPDRDPATFVLSGSNDGGATFAEIASGDVPAFGARFERQAVHFDNSTAYTTYQLTFPTTVGPSTCCMQIAEIELLGTEAEPAPEAPAPAGLPWSVGMNDDGWPAGDGGGPNTSFVQEKDVNELPGNPASPEVAQQGDDDYYWAGDYSTVIAGNGDYTPVGLVEANEESAERAFAGEDNDLRYHFNLPDSLKATDQLTVSYDALNLHTGEDDSRYGIEVYFNNVQVQSEIVIREAELGQTYTTEPFTLASVNAEVGSGYDNIITLKGVNYNAEGGGNWMGIDYVELSKAPGLVAHFPLDSDGDSSDGGFKASTVADVTFGAAGANGATGTSASFNGTSSLIQHDWSADLNPEGSFTLALWARSDGGAGAWNSPVTSRHDLYNEGQASQGYLIYDNNPSGVWTFWSGNGTVDGNWQVLDGPAANIGEWEHLAIVYDSGAEMKKLYVNGELAVEASDIVAPNDTTPLNIGAGGDYGGTFHFKGDLDDIGLWNLALSQEEIQDVMNNGVAPAVGDAPGLSIVNNGDGTITVTFEGRLEAAPTVNGPWQDSGLTSPATIPADEAQQYGRAVLD